MAVAASLVRELRDVAMASTLEEISQTVLRLATPDMKPKKLFKAVREEHPEASRKEIVRAAFLAVITHSDANPEAAARLHDFALRERADGNVDAPSSDEPGAAPSFEEARRPRQRKIKLISE
jgi:hypothetical protein